MTLVSALMTTTAHTAHCGPSTTTSAHGTATTALTADYDVCPHCVPSCTDDCPLVCTADCVPSTTTIDHDESPHCGPLTSTTTSVLNADFRTTCAQ